MRKLRATYLSIPVLVLCAAFWQLAAGGEDPLFQKAISGEDPFMLTAWGRRYEAGVGVDRDPAKAIRLYCKAAKKGDIDAQYQLAQIYAFGRGVAQDRELAAAWTYKAASKHTQAATLLKLLKFDAKPKRRATCPTGPGASVVSRPHPASGEIAALVRSLAPRYRLDPNLVLAVVEAESNFNPKARSHKNAQGLMQLIPATAERFGVRDVWDPEQNLRGGMAYLRWLLDYFDGDVKLALAGYNAGEKAVERHGGVPPYRETQAYVKRILRRLGAEDALESS
jgi:soluble lytic murein transglycosylase-like protein